jgi:hypothetical protein
MKYHANRKIRGGICSAFESDEGRMSIRCNRSAMPDPAFILDYASPRKRSNFRLSSASLLETRWTGGDLCVREWLAGQGGAVGAIAMSAITIGIMMWTLISEEYHRPLAIGWVIFTGLVFVGWLALVPTVIQQTWRETLVEIVQGMVRLKMGGPFSCRRFEWRFDQIEAIRVIPTQAREGAPLLAEIEILADGAPPIRLFTDHTEPRLAQIGAEMDRAMKEEIGP